MTNSILRSVRFAFVTLLLGLTVYTVIESALGARFAGAQAAADGLSTCGTQEQPCTLAAIAVVVEARSAARTLVAAEEGLAACGTQAQPCLLEPVAVEARADAEGETARLASTAPRARTTMHAGS
ncbi:MAG: hypothetical protein KY467_16490 [Gemmatimonadetes bacterium]|nr:hypothetical protein [Gemmatimonadota bacterium]